MKKGDMVTIYNRRMSDGELMVEGQAKLVSPIKDIGLPPRENGEWWKVRFLKETDTYTRFVDRA